MRLYFTCARGVRSANPWFSTEGAESLKARL